MRFLALILLSLVFGAAAFGAVAASLSGLIPIYLGLPLEIAFIGGAFFAARRAEFI